MNYINLRRWLTCVAFIWLAALLTGSPVAQGQGLQPPRTVGQNTVRIGSEEVLLDIVARGGHDLAVLAL